MPKKKTSRYPRDKKGRFKHLEVVRKRGEYRKPGFHEGHHKDGNPKNYSSKNIELKYNSEHRLDHHIEKKEKKLKKYNKF